MANFTFSKDEYFKMLHQALNEPGGKAQGISAPGSQAIDRLLQAAKSKRLGVPSIPRNIPQARG